MTGIKGRHRDSGGDSDREIGLRCMRHVAAHNLGANTRQVSFLSRIFTVAPPLQNEFKFARNKSLKQLETDARMAHHCHSFMDVFRKASWFS